MHIGIICSTRYQLLNALNFSVSWLDDNKTDEIDLFFSLPELENAREMQKELRKLNLFENITLFRSPDYGLKKTIRKARTLSFLMSGQSAFAKLAIDELPDELYDAVMIPCAALQFDLFLARYRPSRIWLLDDGIGSYQGDIIAATLSHLRRYTAGLRRFSFEAEALYVNNASICSSLSSPSISQLPKLNKQRMEMFRPVFEKEKNTFYNQTDWVYLELPRFTSVGSEDDMKRVVWQSHLDTIFRPHPAKTVHQNALGMRIDAVGGIWEFVCYDAISENNVLIGSASTALLTPKMLFNREPFVVLLYRMFGEATEPIRLAGDKIKSILEAGYSDKSKIFAPSSLEELNSILLYLNTRSASDGSGSQKNGVTVD